MASRRAHRAALFTAFVWAAFAAFTLGSYGLTSDSPSLFYAGDRHLFWLTHPLTRGALDFVHADPPQFHTDFFRFPEPADPFHYPVFPGFIAALTSALFHGGLGWLSSIDGHQLGLALLQAADLYVFVWYAVSLFGPVAGLAGGLALAFFPCIAGHAVNNAKDLPCVVLYGASLMAGALGLSRRSPRHLLACGLLAGVGLSCKLNAAFALANLVLWTPIAWWAFLRGERLKPSLVLAYVAIPLVAAATFVLLWPWLWAGQALTFGQRLTLYADGMIRFSQSPRADFTAYPLRCLLYTTPPLLLVFSALGACRAGVEGRTAREGRALWALAVSWVALPLLRIAWPHSMFYDGNRHFLEYVPGLCVLVGLGFELVWAWVSRGGWPWPWIARATLGAALALALAIPIAAYHPYEVAYFNWLAGGLGGAQRSALLFVPGEDWRSPGTEGDYWHASVRDFLRHVGEDKIVPADVPIGTCGTMYDQARANWSGPPLHFVDPHEQGRYLYVGPRESFCGWAHIRDLETERPVLLRVERGGGLIYEILGPPVPYPLPSVSPRSAYDPAVMPLPHW